MAAGVLELVVAIAVEEPVSPAISRAVSVQNRLDAAEEVRGHPDQLGFGRQELLGATLCSEPDVAEKALEGPPIFRAKHVAVAADRDGETPGCAARDALEGDDRSGDDRAGHPEPGGHDVG
jgi:hypothetical protein